MSDFSNELIETVAQSLNDDWARNYQSATWDELCPEEQDKWRVVSRRVLPLIEKRVIDGIAYEAMEVDFEVCGGCGTIIDIDAESCGCEYPPRGKTKTFYVISSDTLNGPNHG